MRRAAQAVYNVMKMLITRDSEQCATGAGGRMLTLCAGRVQCDENAGIARFAAMCDRCGRMNADPVRRVAGMMGHKQKTQAAYALCVGRIRLLKFGGSDAKLSRRRAMCKLDCATVAASGVMPARRRATRRRLQQAGATP